MEHTLKTLAIIEQAENRDREDKIHHGDSVCFLMNLFSCCAAGDIKKADYMLEKRGVL